jgi:hypothetical protein
MFFVEAEAIVSCCCFLSRLVHGPKVETVSVDIILLVIPFIAVRQN